MSVSSEVSSLIEALPQCQLIALNTALGISLASRQPLAKIIKERNLPISDDLLAAIKEHMIKDSPINQRGYQILYPLLDFTGSLILASYNPVESLLVARSFITQAKNSQECADFIQSGHHLACDQTLADAYMACQQWGEELHDWLQSHK